MSFVCFVVAVVVVVVVVVGFFCCNILLLPLNRMIFLCKKCNYIFFLYDTVKHQIRNKICLYSGCVQQFRDNYWYASNDQKRPYVN